MKSKFVMNASWWCVLFVLGAGVLVGAAWAQQQGGNNLAPGAPGNEARWPSAGKNGVGTANTMVSKVWFTLRGGVLDEVYYPTVDVANTQELQFVVVSGGRVETEGDDATHRIEIVDPRALSFRQINTAKSGAWTITKTYTADPERHTVLIEVQFKSRTPAAHALYLYYDPSLNNSGLHDSAWVQGDALVASDAAKTSALLSSTGFSEMTNGYLGTSDGLTQLRAARGRLTNRYPRAADGNAVQVARVHAAQPFTIALGFGQGTEEALGNARRSLAKGFARVRAEYERGWHEYLESLRRVEPKYQAQFDMAAMILRAHEDKTYRGANIASLSVPWGGGATANEPNVGGYHLVWSRDLYQVATALHALGDKAGADRALDYLFKVQQKPDGSFPQNSWLDGRPFWGSLQLDEVAYPLILAYTLGRTDNETWTKHVKPAADFIVRTGARTPQERWEEKAGYSPSTVAAEIAGLVCAAEIARRNDAHAAAGIYLATADEWARNVERWTVTSTGVHGVKTHYIRIAHVDDDPNDGDLMNAGNGGADYDEREYVDAGFLELVRLGIKRADDPLIAKSLAVVDKVLRVETPNGAAWYRYNHDGYGEHDDGKPWNFDGRYTGKGRLWALLSGERGQYELARGERAAARLRLDHMLGFANDGLMLPEQVWDKAERPRPEFVFGEGTGSATPLAWTMAQFIRLASNLAEGRNLETPDIVAARYASKAIPADAGGASSGDAEEEREPVEAGTGLNLGGRVGAGARVYVWANGEAREVKVNGQGLAESDFRVPEGDTTVVIGWHKENGASGFRRIRVRGLTKDELRKHEAGQAASPAFLERVRKAERAPLVENDQVTFVYRGKAKRVEVVGDFTSWSPRRLVFHEVAGTDVKYLTMKFEKDARAEYKFIADGEWINDPLSEHKLDNGVGGSNNFFTMPGYRPSAFGEVKWDLRGTLEKLDAPTSLLEGGKRKVQVYLPPAYARGANERFPVLYLQDGSEYVTRARAALIADQLIAEGRVAPFIIVFVDPIDRFKEYWASDKFAAFMATELVPLIDARYRTRAERGARALMGASLGGVISVWTALKHGDVFARVAGQSTAFQIDDERVVSALAALPETGRERPLKFYFDVGRLEPIWKVNRRVRVMLEGKGYPVTYREIAAGHNWTNWRDQFADALAGVWGD